MRSDAAAPRRPGRRRIGRRRPAAAAPARRRRRPAPPSPRSPRRRRCDDFVEPDGIAPAFGAPRALPALRRRDRVLHGGRADAGCSTRQRGRRAPCASRYGRGSVTADAPRRIVRQRPRCSRDDNALALVARCCSCARRPRSGSSTRRRGRRSLPLLWQHGAPAFLLGGAALAAAPLARRRPLRPAARRRGRRRGARSASRSARTAAFIAARRRRGAASGELRALEDEARRSIRRLRTPASTRASAREAIARRTGVDAGRAGARR